MIATNALVTYDNLTTMGLIAKGSPATGNRIATKSFISSNYYVNIFAQPYASYANNRCPPYQTIIPISTDGYGLAAIGGSNAALSTNGGVDWTNISQFAGITDNYRNAVKVSSTGQFMLLKTGTSVNQIWLSSNYGGSWMSIANTGTTSITDMAISDDGTYIFYTLANDYLYVSINGGTTFNPNTILGTSNWKGIAINSTGQYVTLTSFNSYLKVSYDYGSNFVSKTSYPATGWIPVVMSKDGTYQLAGRDTIYRSTNGGSTWTNTGASVANGWAILAMSGNGQYALGLGDFDPLDLWRSTNYGANWSISGAGNQNWRSLAIAPKGDVQLVGTSGIIYLTNYLYRSTNYGANFGAVSNSVGWTSVAISDGFTPPPTPPTLYYYNVTKYNCSSCTVSATNLLASAPFQLVNGIFYTIADGYVYYCNYSTVAGSVDVDLTGAANSSTCTLACMI
jgi:hypothetical protein